MRHQKRTRSRRGYILVATALSLLFLLGVAGLAVDIGRMYITKSEAQAYVDSASLNAARQMDGTSAGITRAVNSLSADTGKWRFDTLAFTAVTAKFGTSASGPFTATPPTPPTNYEYVQVTAAVDLPMFLIRPITGPSAGVAAGAVASRRAVASIPAGVFPFSPYTRAASPDNAADPFGYQIGNEYTLRWGAPGDRTDCGTDATSPNLADNGSVRGYCCVSNSAAGLREAIVSGQTDPVAIGDFVEMENGAKNTEMSAIGDRVDIDSNTTATTYANYVASGSGNGARVIVVVVNSGKPNYVAIGFAGFFLKPSTYYAGLHGNDSACAEYIGAWTQGAPPAVAGGSGAYRLRLVK